MAPKPLFQQQLIADEETPLLIPERSPKITCMQELEGVLCFHYQCRRVKNGAMACCLMLICTLGMICMGFFAVHAYNWWGGDRLNGLPNKLQHDHPYSLHHALADSFSFLAVGDWGRHGLYNQSQIAIQMGRIGEELGIEFVVSVGDNFYQTGLKGADDPAFSSSFTRVYTAQSLQKPWYTVLGNHDYMGDALVQINGDLTAHDSRWFCKREFQLQHSLCKSSFRGACNNFAEFFFIDTTPFIDEYWYPNATHTFDWRGLPSNRSEQLKSQLEDLTDKLSQSEATWKIVIGHHTIRSIGRHGDMPELVEHVLPILESHKVDLYINGHDHNLQHIKRTDSSVHLFTSGAGSKAYGGLRSYGKEEGVQYVFDGQGFLAVTVKIESISLSFYDVFGDVLYSYLLQK